MRALACLTIFLWTIVAGATVAIAEVPRIRVLVQLGMETAPEAMLSRRAVAAQRSSILWTQLAMSLDLEGTDHDLTHLFGTVPYAALEVSYEALAALAASPYVHSIAGDGLLRASLDESVEVVKAQAAWDEGLKGSGWAVAVLDTGVDRNHSHLEGRVVAEACFSSDGGCPDGSNKQTGPGAAKPCDVDGCQHGTHVAGIVAARGDTARGVAPRADVIAVQVFSRFQGSPFCPEGEACPLTYTSDLIRALEWVYKRRADHDIAAVNMSLGGGYYSSESQCDSENAAIKSAIDNLRAAGIATLVASGNEGYLNGLGTPACVSSAISVGSVTKSREVSWFSNAAPFLNLLAPGSDIRSTVPGDRFATMSGTSMATPHVAGAWAVLKEKDPAASVSQILKRLKKTGQVIYDPAAKLTKKLVNVGEASELGGPRVKVTVLNGQDAAAFDAGDPLRITWKGDPVFFTYDVLYTRDGGDVWEELAAGVVGDSFLWTIPSLEAKAHRCRIRVIGRDAEGQVVDQDKNNRRFKIRAAVPPAPPPLS